MATCQPDCIVCSCVVVTGPAACCLLFVKTGSSASTPPPWLCQATCSATPASFGMCPVSTAAQSHGHPPPWITYESCTRRCEAVAAAMAAAVTMAAAAVDGDGSCSNSSRGGCSVFMHATCLHMLYSFLYIQADMRGCVWQLFVLTTAGREVVACCVGAVLVVLLCLERVHHVLPTYVVYCLCQLPGSG